MAKIDDLEKSLNTALDDFTKEIEFNYETFTGDYLTRDDMRELAKQTFYMTDQFKTHILEYLKGL